MFARRIYAPLARGLCRNSSGSPGATPTAGSPSATVNTNVPGLSSTVIIPSDKQVGPGVDPNKSGAYKSPEYYCYSRTSYYDAEIEMAKYRLPQPSSLKK